MDKKIIELINSNMKLKDIAEQTNISYSTIRKMASIVNFIKECSFLKEIHIEKIMELGLNAVVLVPLKTEQQYLIDILESIDSSKVTRKDLLDLIKNIKEITNSKANLTKRYSIDIEMLDEEINSCNFEIQEWLDIREILSKEFKFITGIKKTKPDIFKAYLQLVGLFNKRYCLAKKVNLNLWNKLRRLRIIEAESEYVDGKYITISYIKDMEQFVKNTINAFKVNDYFRHDMKIHGIYPVKYITIDKQIEPIISNLKSKIAEYETKKIEYRNEILKSSKKAISNYFEQRKFRDKLIDRDTITHSNIARGGLKWLINNDYIGTIELKKDKYQFDAVAYNENEIIILEAKASTSDLNSDDKLLNYMNYCNRLYIISNEKYVCNAAMKIHEGVGVILLDKAFRFQKIMKEAEFICNSDSSLKRDINVKNSKLLVMTL